jgi:hypothetical protein
MIYDTLKTQIANGYGIGKETYTDGTIIYSVMKVESDTSRTTTYEVAGNIARKLIKEEGAKLVFERSNVKALNFIPTPVKPNCVRYLTNQL